MKSEMKQNTEVTSSSDFTPNQTAVISNIHISERKLSRAVSSLILSPSQRRMQTLTRGKNLLMGHLLAALRQALLSATSSSRGVYMTKAVRRLMRQASTSEINTHRTSNKAKSSEQQTVWGEKQHKTKTRSFPSSEKLFQWFGEFMNICAFLDLLELLEVVLSRSSQGDACASLTREQPRCSVLKCFLFLSEAN